MSEQQITPSVEQSIPSGWPDWQKQIVAVVLILLIPVAIYLLQPVMSALIMTFVAAFVLMYPIRWLQRLKLSYRISALLVYFIFFLISLIAIILFMAYAVSSLIDTLQSTRAFIEQIIGGVTGDTEGGLAGLLNLDFLSNGLAALSVVGAGISLVSDPAGFVTEVVNRLSGFTSFVSNYAFFIVLLLFFLLEWPRTVGILGRTLPSSSRREYAILIKRMIGLGESYLLGSFVIVLFYWLVAALLFYISGVPNAIVLGLIVAIPNFIPQGGGLVSAILVFIFSLVVGSDTILVNRLIFAFVQMAIFMLISGIAYYFVDARIYSKSVNTPVWMILVGIMVFGAFFGVIGLFVAAAVVAMIGEALGFTLKKLRGVDPYPDEPEPPLFLSADELAGETNALTTEEESPTTDDEAEGADESFADDGTSVSKDEPEVVEEEAPSDTGEVAVTDSDTETSEEEVASEKDGADAEDGESKT